MTLFFYGAIALNNDEAETTTVVLRCAQEVRWILQLNMLPEETSFEELFGFADDHDEWLFFELDYNQLTDVEPLYDEYGGDTMLAHYRTVAKQIGVDDAGTLEFGASHLVDEAYRNRPADLPVIRFIESVLTALPDRGFVVCFDQDFENRIHCREVVGDKTQILREAWLTAAFGFTWPNLRLKTPTAHS